MLILSDLGGVRQKCASLTKSHEAGEGGCSFHSHFPPWEKSKAERVSLGTELCCLWGGGDMGKVKLFLLSSSIHLFMDFCSNEVLESLHWAPILTQRYSHPWMFVKISVSAGGMRAGISYSAILLTSLTQYLIRFISSFLSRKSIEDRMRPTVGKISKNTGSLGAPGSWKKQRRRGCGHEAGKLPNKHHILEDLDIVVWGALEKLVGHCLPRLGNTFNATTILNNSRGRQAMQVLIKWVNIWVCLYLSPTSYTKRWQEIWVENDPAGMKKTLGCLTNGITSSFYLNSKKISCILSVSWCVNSNSERVRVLFPRFVSYFNRKHS